MPKVLSQRQKSARNCCDEDEDAADVEEEVEGDNGREGEQSTIWLL